ncbi:Delta(24)-sterol C-methyltransferase [Cyanidiococcus yangmingshanensis]|uniref:Methyltransferase n=1 Tax=Cyanidiococcus yangmingshanensis TaxID=2690220 RepID=A0A7J7IPF9_9RHOD|nr:Delta(24)-sterol C-methyltransferase [Cyanidiococcus yangmingshanensis]
MLAQDRVSSRSGRRGLWRLPIHKSAGLWHQAATTSSDAAAQLWEFLFQFLPVVGRRGHAKSSGKSTAEELDEYLALFALALRKRMYKELSNGMYDIATDFYEWGWGPSFHFAVYGPDETFREATRRYEYTIALRLKLDPDAEVIDLGCGVGGPLRNIARFARCHVVGVNICDYQILRGLRYIEDEGLMNQCTIIKADFNDLPFATSSKDGAYQIEATCHSPDKRKTYSEVFRVLKPGTRFVGYEWALTNRYDASNAEHEQLKFGIEIGNGIPDLMRAEEITQVLTQVGFEIEDAYDAAELSVKPWYTPLSGEDAFHWSGFRHTRLGHHVTHALVSALETMRIAPKGSAKMSRTLMDGARDLVAAGRLGIFTPSFFIVARKPLELNTNTNVSH